MWMSGEFRELEDTLDKFSETLNMIIDDSNAVLKAFQHNNFKRPIRSRDREISSSLRTELKRRAGA